MDPALEATVVERLKRQRLTIALAESCTGGLIAHRLTNVPGASEVFLAGLVTYSNEAKEKFLGVRAGTLREHGAVSEAVAREMAEGARRACGSDYAVAVTGIAGPAGATPGKPVGTVFIAIASGEGTEVVRKDNSSDRITFKELTSTQALELILATVRRSGS